MNPDQTVEQPLIPENLSPEDRKKWTNKLVADIMLELSQNSSR